MNFYRGDPFVSIKFADVLRIAAGVNGWIPEEGAVFILHYTIGEKIFISMELYQVDLA